MKTIRHSVAIFFAIALLSTSFSLPVFASSHDMLQCMADCVMQEGEDETDTCKLRCSKIGINMNQQPKDCMAIFKQCKKICEGDTSCRKECKTNLLNCV